MRRETLTQGKIIELTREVLHGFYSRSIDHLAHYLSDDFIWIGAFDFQFTTTKQQFLDTIQSELTAISFNMSDEQYALVTRDRDTFILYCKVNLTGALPTGDLLELHTRLSVVWKYIENELKLIHVHGSNAQGVDLTDETQLNETNNQSDNFIDYITAAAVKMPPQKRSFRLPSGEYKILSESDISYLKSVGQTTEIYTKDGSVVISGILRTHQKILSNSFFRIHKSYLINTDYLESFRRYQVTLCNESNLSTVKEINLPMGKEKYLPLKELCAQNNTSDN